jgi:hypothetical protein
LRFQRDGRATFVTRGAGGAPLHFQGPDPKTHGQTNSNFRHGLAAEISRQDPDAAMGLDEREKYADISNEAIGRK